MLVAPSVFVGPNQFDPILIFGFIAAVLGGLDSPVGAVVGGVLLGLALSYVSGYEGSSLVTLAALVDPHRGADDPPEGTVLQHTGAPRMSAVAARIRRPHSTLARSLGLVALAGAVLFVASEALGAYDDLQLANGAYYFAVLAGLTVLIGLSGQISLGHGALMAVGAYTVALLIGNEQLGAGSGAARGGRRHRARGGRSSALPRRACAVPISPARRSPSRSACRRSRTSTRARSAVRTDSVINPPTPPSALGASFPLERWEAWIACAGALRRRCSC